MRSAAFERAWLDAVARSAGRWSENDAVQRFYDEVRERLEKGGREYGEDAWLEKSVIELAGEAREEFADAPAWLTLAAQRLNQVLADGALDGDAAAAIQQEFIEAAAGALVAHERLSGALAAYRVATAEHNFTRT